MRFIERKTSVNEATLGWVHKPDFEKLKKLLDEVITEKKGNIIEEKGSVSYFLKDRGSVLSISLDEIFFINTKVRGVKPFTAKYDDIATVEVSDVGNALSVDILTKRGSSFGCFLLN